MENFENISSLAERIFIQLVQSDDLVTEQQRYGRTNQEIAKMSFAAAVSFFIVKKDYFLESQKFERSMNAAEQLEAAGFYDDLFFKG